MTKMKCKDCKIEMIRKGIVTTGMMYSRLVEIYQCPKCKNIEIVDTNK